MYFDAHAHTQFAAFKNDWKNVIDRALAGGVWMINVGTQKDTSRRAVEFANSYPEGVYASVGLHPVHTEKLSRDAQEFGLSADSTKGFQGRGEAFDYAFYRELASDPKVLTIGECGLDYYRLHAASKETQRRAFEQQIVLAHDLQKPLMIHCRDAFDDLIAILASNSRLLVSPVPGLVHYFTGTVAHANSLLDLGFSFTFGGLITFARDYDESIKMIPMERIFSETDAPYATPLAYRDLRNEPAFVIEVVNKLAEIKRVSAAEMKLKIWENASRFLGFCDHDGG